MKNVRFWSGFLHVILKLIHQKIIIRKSHSQRSYAKKPPNHPTVVRVVMARLEEERHG